MKAIIYHAVGIIHTPFTHTTGMPIQPRGAIGIRGSVEVFPEYGDGLKDLAGFSHIILLYHFHQAPTFQLRVVPFLVGRAVLPARGGHVPQQRGPARGPAGEPEGSPHV